MDYLVVNAAAGAGQDPDIWLARLASCGIHAQPLRDLYPGARPALGKQDRLLTVGGDGTMNRMASVCVATGCILGVLPGGNRQ